MNDWLDAESRAERALQLTETQQWQEALNELEAAIEINPNDPIWHAQRGQILDQMDKFDTAVEAYQAALSLAPDHTEIKTALSVDMIRVGRFEDAVRILAEVAHARPDYEPAYCHRIAAYTRLHEHDMAEQMFYLAQQINPNCPNCFHHIAESLACRDLYDKAIYCWEQVLDLASDYPHVRQRIAEVYRAQKRLDRAQEYYLEALRNEPGNTEIIADLGDLLIEMEDLPGAAAKFQHLIELDPECAHGHVMLGLLASQDDDLERANRCFRRALELKDSYPGVRGHLGEIELRRGNPYEALHELQLALEDDPNDCVALMAMGNCLLELAKPTEAADLFERIIEMHPRIAGAHHNLAVCRFLEGSFDVGIEHCQAALAIEPKNVLAIHKLALAYLHQGQWRQARQMIDRGLEINPDHTGLNALPRHFWGLRIRHIISRLKKSRAVARLPRAGFLACPKC